MCDAVTAQPNQLGPCIREYLVGQLRGIEAVEGTTGDRLVSENEAVRLRGGERDETRSADAELRAVRATSASCSTARRSDENGRSSPRSRRRVRRYRRKSRSALRSSAPNAFTNNA